MTTAQLTGLCVLVTRPDPAGAILCALIDAQGGQALHVPTIAFVPPPDPDQFERAIAKLGKQDWLVFISPQAVYATMPALKRAWPVLPPTVRFAAIGAGTAKALQASGYTAIYPTDDWHSDGLLELPEFRTIKGSAIAIIRGVGGREVLEQALTLRGATVLSVIGYQRMVPEEDITRCREALKARAVDAIVCTSFDSVQNLKTLLGATSWSDIKSIPLIVVSERIKSLAGDLGFQTICVASNASSEAILVTLGELV